MNFHHLKYFYDAVNEGGVGGAAKKNFVTQSAVSQSIRKLEESLDCELLVHQKNRFSLTDEGRAVFERCRAIFQSVEDLRSGVNAAKKEAAGPVAFATSQSIALGFLPEFLAAFRDKHPLVKPNFLLGTTQMVKRWVEDRAVDFALTVDDGSLRAFDSETLYEGRFVAISTGKTDKNACYLLTKPRPETERLHKAYRTAHGKPLPVAMEVDSWEVIKGLATHGLGVGYVPDFLLRRGRAKDLNVRKEAWQPKVPYRICVIRTKGAPSTKSSQLFIAELSRFLK